ncbi:hypothetical protein SBOR_8531 [Sclerotinia borealis F-4128]|uniref:DUF7820 domain-containing protein n=1 Tax=Sclerotinia borealis (strain F-4128) TaxID=1432307 RepID=W9C5R3_SCLBF|nr:hypothetical protein SBOR_8531 [Sclerotinia borealis F-4128]
MGEPNHPLHTGHNRRDSQRSTRLSMQMQDEDEDDYASAAMGVSNGGGYRPSDSIQNTYTPPPPSSPSSRQPQSQLPPIERRRASTPPPRPSSTTKPKGIDSFALRNDGGIGQMSRGPTFASPGGNENGNGLTRTYTASSASTVSSVSSASSDLTVMRPESPYQGPSGPSHPYNMYNQESRLARTASIATTSTMPAPPREMSYTGPSGPTHPYGMYPQSTVSSDTDHLPVAPIPVGFPGLNNDYQRRLGPEGEEAADLIGPDGHTEQLPPYTKYADEAFARKSRRTSIPTPVPVPLPVPTIQIPAPVVPISGAGGMGLATRNPEFASQDDLDSSRSRQSTRSIMSDRSSHHANTASMEFSEKPQLKKWQVAAKKKLCGIVPVWVVVLITLVFILFAIVLGTVFALLKPKHNDSDNQNDSDDSQTSQTTVFATMTTTFDATPLSYVPTSLPTLPTGTYNMPLTVPSTAQSSCIMNTAENSAWSCSIATTPLEMSIVDIPGGDELSNKEIMMNYGDASLKFYPYGAQPPILSTAQVLTLVNDSEFPSRGPAWFFQISYNKVVVLPHKTFSTKSKREQPAAGFMNRKGVAQAGDQPWFCYWNGTLLEAFIYVNETSSAGSTSTVTSGTSFPTPTGGYGGGYGTSTHSSDVPSSSAGVQSQGSSSSGSSQQDNPQFLPQYPKVYKVAERRVPRGGQTVPAYCVAHQILSDGMASPLMNSTGQPITIYLNETEPTSLSPLQDRSLVSDLFERDITNRDGDESCGCVWLES